MNFLIADRARRMEILRYLIAGGVNFVFTFTIFFTLIEVLRVNYHIALTITWVASVLFNYTIHMVWVFRVADAVPRDGPLGKYFLVYATAYLLNWGILYGLVEFFDADALLAQLIAIPFVIVYNYAVIKFVLLRRGNTSLRLSKARDP
ncbi:GtrA family protein [Maricaulaceae bacterium MS644]